MPGFLGGSSGSSGTGGEITFPKEFIDPVTKLRVSQPENLIDTDFEYGLQPTKWETVELINNTPSFFSKSGDTTIPGIISIATNNGTREITVTTATDHGLAVGIPINVTGTKSVTADGSYIINSIPNALTFTYLCKDEQSGNNSIEDLYTSIITGEFFQGSQIRISDAEGITTDAAAISVLTVKTDSTHGFGLNTPFYFLNLNSTISQEFEASNTAAKSFDSSNSATAQTFDGSNTLSTFNIDWSNSATIGGTTSTITDVFVNDDTIRVSHGAENFAGQPLGTPLYYNLSVPASSGYFATNPRGVVFLKTTNTLNSPAGQSTFQVSATPDGDAIDIVSSMSGTFQLANQARTFAGNNANPITQTAITVIKDNPVEFDGSNQGYVGAVTNGSATVQGYSDTILVSVTAGAGLDYYVGAMVRYSTTGSAATGLTNNRTYFINSFVANATPNFFNITLKEYPDSASALTPTGGSGVQTFLKIGVSTDKDIVHAKNANFLVKDMVEYSFPAGAGGRFTADETKQFYFIQKAYDAHNYELSGTVFAPTSATGGVIGTYTSAGITYRTHTFSTVGSTNFVVSSVGSSPAARYLIVAGGGGGGNGTGQGYEAGGGGAGGLLQGNVNLTATTYSIVVGNGGAAATNGQNSSAFGLTAIGGGAGGSSPGGGAAGGSGGGGAHANTSGGAGTAGQGFAGATPGQSSSGGGGGGAGEAGNTDGLGEGGDGLGSNISGNTVFYAGGGAAFHAPSQGNNIGPIIGEPGVGGGGNSNQDIGTSASLFSGTKNATANTGGGGGGGYDTSGGGGGSGGSGIVIVSYPITAPPAIIAPVCSGGQSTTDVTINNIVYRVHQYTTVGSHNFVVTSPGNQVFEYLVIAGGGGGGSQHSSGGGAGGYRCSVPGEFSGRLSPAETPLTLTAGTYPVVVGGGGAGGPANTGATRASVGGNSTFHTITSIGGGGGGGWAGDNGSERAQGGSGGGAWVSAGSSGGNPGAGIAGQGFGGGAGTDTFQPHVGSGGGGAGGPGDQGKVGGRRAAGRGGIGIPSNITGTPTYRASGGGGGSYWSAGQTQPARAEARQGGGGRGGMAYQSDQQPGTLGIAGAANTGGGGGATGQYELAGAAGGSGIVIIRYPIAVV
jgi:hypothetical protein